MYVEHPSPHNLERLHATRYAAASFKKKKDSIHSCRDRSGMILHDGGNRRSLWSALPLAILRLIEYG